MVERPGQDRRCGIVHDQRNAERPADLRHLADREDDQLGVRQRLGVIGAGAIVGGAAEILRIGRVDEADLDALLAQRIGEQVPGAAIKVGRAHHIVARHRQVLQRQRRGRLAGRYRQRGDPALQRRQPLLQHVARRVHDPGIEIAQLLQREQVRRVLGRGELV